MALLKKKGVARVSKYVYYNLADMGLTTDDLLDQLEFRVYDSGATAFVDGDDLIFLHGALRDNTMLLGDPNAEFLIGVPNEKRPEDDRPTNSIILLAEKTEKVVPNFSGTAREYLTSKGAFAKEVEVVTE